MGHVIVGVILIKDRHQSQADAAAQLTRGNACRLDSKGADELATSDAGSDEVLESLATVRARLADTAAKLAAMETIVFQHSQSVERAKRQVADAKAAREAAEGVLAAETSRFSSELAALRERAERAEALHAHELGEARRLHNVVTERDSQHASDREQWSAACAEVSERLARIDGLYAAENGEAERLRSIIAEREQITQSMIARHHEELGRLRSRATALAGELRRTSEDLRMLQSTQFYKAARLMLKLFGKTPR